MTTRGQQGFTILEFMVAMGVSGLILPVVMGTIFLMTTRPARINAALVVQQDIDGASSWFNRDLSQALTTDVVDGAAPVNQMRVDWSDQTAWAVLGSEAHFVRYTLSGTNLLRNYDGTTITAARRVADIKFSRSGKFITVAITSSLGGQSVALSYFITPRADGALP